MKRVYRLISTALLLVMIASAMLFAQSCTDKGGDIDKETTTSLVSTTEGPNTDNPLPELEVVDYGGYEFKALWPSTHLGEHFLHNEIAVEEDSADIIESAVFMRNLIVEEQYGINIVSVIQKYTDIISTMEKQHNAGDVEYDAFCSQLVNVTPLAIKGVLADYEDMEYYKEEYPWWNHDAMEDFAIVNHKFFGTGDIIVSDDYYANCVMANLALIADYGLDNPYGLVRNGTWTVDKLMQMSKGIAKSLDNNLEEWTYQDQYGLVITNSNSKSMFYGFGKSLVTTDSNGDIEWVMTPEYTQDALEKIVTLFNSADTFNTQPSEHRAPGLSHAQTAEKMFGEGRVLFKVAALLSTELQRSSGVTFAVLPMPKYTVEQDRYYSLLNDATLVCVPSLADDLTRTSLILSAMGRASIDTLTPAFFEQTLTVKNINDADSVEMVEIILDTIRVPDIATTFDYGKFLTDFYSLVANNSTDFASVYNKDINVALAEIKNVTEKFK